MKNSFKNAVQALPDFLRAMLCSLPESVTKDVTEIRIRAGRPLVLTAGEKTYFLSRTGVHSRLPSAPFVPSAGQLADCVAALCDYSVYSRQNEICEGFITLRGGSRAGVCGTAVIDGGRITNVKNISSVNLRIAHEIPDCSKSVLEHVSPENGVLLCGAPCSGKTTVLRDMARVLSLGSRVSLIDSRGELAAVFRGEPQNDVGFCDVLDGYSRRDGFEIAVRCMSPEIVMCDEIGADDIPSILGAGLSGAAVIATAHCRGKDEFRNKEGMMKLTESGIFESVVFLGTDEHVGQVQNVVSAEELRA